MALKVRHFRSAEELSLFFMGAALGGAYQCFSGLVGKTLTLTRPAGTVTFVAGADTAAMTLTFAEVQAQIQAAIPAVCLKRTGDFLIYLIEATPANGVAVDAASSALPYMGLGKTVSTKVINAPGGAAPALVTAYYDSQSSGHVAILSE